MEPSGPVQACNETDLPLLIRQCWYDNCIQALIVATICLSVEMTGRSMPILLATRNNKLFFIQGRTLSVRTALFVAPYHFLNKLHYSYVQMIGFE